MAAMTEVNERDIDFLLAEEIECNPDFAAWLLTAVGCPGSGWQDIISIQRSVTTVHGETDVLVVVRVSGGGRRALMLENKISASFTEGQPERYRLRGEAGIAEGNWDSFRTVLLAPRKYIDGVTDGTFDHTVVYEDIDAQFAAMPSGPRRDFKRRILAFALGKTKQPWVRKIDPHITRFFADLRTLAAEMFPDIPFPADKAGRAPTSTWLMVTVAKHPRSRVTLQVKPGNGNVDLHFAALPVGELRTLVSDILPPGADTVEFRRPGAISSAIRFSHPSMDVRQPFADQEALAAPMVESAHVLWQFAKKHKDLLKRGLT